MNSIDFFFENINIGKVDAGANTHVLKFNKYREDEADSPITIEVDCSSRVFNKEYQDIIGDYNFTMDIKSLWELMLEVGFCFENWDTSEFEFSGFDNNDATQQIHLTNNPDTFIEFVNKIFYSDLESAHIVVNEMTHLTWVIHDIIHADRDFENRDFKSDSEYYAIVNSWAWYYAKGFKYNAFDKDELEEIVKTFNERCKGFYNGNDSSWVRNGVKNITVEGLIENIKESLQELYEEELIDNEILQSATTQVEMNLPEDIDYEEDEDYDFESEENEDYELETISN